MTHVRPSPLTATATARPARLVAVVIAVLAVLTVLGTVTPVAATAHSASTTAAPSGLRRSLGTGDRPTVRLIEQDGVVGPDDDFVAFFEVSGVPAGSDLAVDIYPAITTQAQLDAARDGTPRNSIGTFPVIDLPGDPLVAPVQSGFVINLYGPDGPAKGGGWAKRLTRAGVYPLKVRLRGPDNTTVETVVTYLLRGPDSDDELEPASVALLAEIRSGTDATDLLAAPAAPLPDAVLDGIATLTDVATGHPSIPLTLSVTPEVAQRLAAGAAPPAPADPSTPASTPSTSSSSSTSTAPDDADPVTTSATVLAGLVELLEPADRELLGAPAHDIDATELTALDLSDELRAQVHHGSRILADTLEPPVGARWQVTTRLDPAGIEALAALDVAELLVPPATVEGTPPTLPSRVAGTSAATRLLVVDPALATGDHTDPGLAAHQLVAHVAALAAIDDGAPHVVTVALPRTDGDATELDTVLGLLTDNPFVTTRTTTDLLGAARSATDRTALADPATATDQAWAGDLRRTRSLVGSYASMVPDQPALAQVLTDRLSQTTDHRLATDERTESVAAVRADVNARFAEVSIPASDRVTLGARDAQFPLVITSGSDVPVRVVVELSASDRLTIAEPRIEVVLEGDHTEVPIRVRSRLPGDTPLRVRVTTPDGAVLLSEGTYSVRSTAVSGVGLVLTVGAGLFLAVWWGRHILRSRRHRGRHAR